MQSTGNGDGESLCVNAHRVRVTRPDTIQIWWNGHCNREDFAAILDFVHRELGDRPQFVIAYLSELKSVDPDARKFSAKDPRNKNVIRIAMVGASFHMRVIMTLVTTALEIFYRDQRGKTRFWDTEQEAFDWIAAERTLLGFDSGGAHESQGD